MKSALVFRTAQMHVIFELIDKLIEKKYKIWCIVQKDSLNNIQNRYPDVNYFTINDAFFSYKKLKADKNLIKKLNGLKFDRIFVPSSTKDADNFLEVRRIIYWLGYRNVTYWLTNGKTVCKRLDIYEVHAEMLLNTKLFMDFILALNFMVSLLCFIRNRVLGGRI